MRWQARGMRRLMFMTSAPPSGGRRVGLFIGLAWLGLLSCVTTQPQEEIVVMVDPAPPPTAAREGDTTSPAGEAKPNPAALLPPPPSSPLLLERLEPVRGGAQQLPPYRRAHPCRMALTGASPAANACSPGVLRRAVHMMQTLANRAKAGAVR